MHSLTRDEVQRIQRAENDAFLTLYEIASERCGTRTYATGGARAFWSPGDDDPGFSCVINLADASDAEQALALMEQAARAAGIPVLGIDGSPGLSERLDESRLHALGYHRDYREHFWGRRLTDEHPAPGDGPSVERIDATQREAFARVLNVGYNLAPDAARGHVFASTIGMPGWTHYLVTFDGVPGAASVLYVTEGVAQLFVTTTMPEFRGRGAQTALIRQRLADGRAAGCDLATSQTVVDNASPRNMARHGFEVLFDRWIYGKRLPGPSP